ncbi:MAG TPA: 4Fe-4S dicluster domain-containing protein [Planctomycetota bacterium]|nr:4Fe-4S dicluster domain-containing protein [Planctomycetota bacterium]
MQYGFLMDHRRCIGCHACTVACKAENNVPVGSFRTWVKYTEKGRFPSVKRHFAILRCNHCSKAPCVTICPVNALEKRVDGIVDIDRDACIGCRACMQACPYDAIYLNEDSGVVEKCHFCAHRIEQNLEPACVIVCPEQAIVVGDLHDPMSRIAMMVAENETLVRRPEQKTGPNVHYLGVEPLSLEPGAAERPSTYIWSERPDAGVEAWPEEKAPTTPDLRTVLDVGHKVEWGWPVALYLVTKAIAAGAAMIAPFLVDFGVPVGSFAERWLPEILALVFTTITTALLVEDLHRPLKFLTLLTRPNKKSWLVRGAWVLIAFSTLTCLILAAHWFGQDEAAKYMRSFNVVLGAAAAGYTAFLFRQCEGRDMWQSRRLLPHLLIQALLCAAVIFWFFTDSKTEFRLWLGVVLALHGAFMSLELRGKHETANARQAAGFLPIVRMGWIGAPYRMGVVLSVLVPGVLLALTNPHRMAPAVPYFCWITAACVLAGLFLFKYAYVRAAQLPPLS